MAKLILRENLIAIQQKREFALLLILATSFHSRLQFSLEFNIDISSPIVFQFKLVLQKFKSRFDEQVRSSVFNLPIRYELAKFCERFLMLILQSIL